MKFKILALFLSVIFLSGCSLDIRNKSTLLEQKQCKEGAEVFFDESMSIKRSTDQGNEPRIHITKYNKKLDECFVLITENNFSLDDYFGETLYNVYTKDFLAAHISSGKGSSHDSSCWVSFKGKKIFESNFNDKNSNCDSFTDVLNKYYLED